MPSQDRASGCGAPLLVAVLCLFAVSCSSYPSLAKITAEINQTRDSTYFLVPGDTVSVAFPFRPEWDHTAIVRPDGKASFLSLGELQVAGWPLSKLNEELSKAYRAKNSEAASLDPEEWDLTATLLQSAPREVVVMGEVLNPGPVPFGGGHLTLVEAIGRAGGPDKGSALLAETMLIRWIPSEQTQRVWHLDARIGYWQTGTPLLLQPHDVIFVPNNTIDRINVWVDKYIRQNLPLNPGFALTN